MYNIFYNCSRLTSVTIGNSVTSIGKDAFSGCSRINDVRVPVSDYATFCENTVIGLISSRIGKPVQLIDGEGAEIKEYVVPEGVTTIGSSAFKNCGGLTSVTIPSDVRSIGNYAFSGCSGINEVKVPVTDYATFCENKALGCIYSSLGMPVKLIDGEGAEIREYVVPEGVVTISNCAFTNCSSLTSVTIPNSVTSLGNSAFSGCSGLISVTIPNGVTSIGECAFSDCSGLNSVSIGTGVLSIGNNAFSTPKKLIWLTNTPPSGYEQANGEVNYVGNDLYNSLQNVTVYPFLSSMFEVDGVKYVPVSPSERTCDVIDCNYNEERESIIIGETVNNRGITLAVNKIMPYALYGNSFIKDLKLSQNGEVEESPESQNVDWGQGIASIGSYAFGGCSSMQTIKIAKSVNSIGDYVFSGCTSLHTVVIDDSEVELRLGSNGSKPMFADCPLDSVYISRKISYPTASDNGFSPFNQNTTLRSLVITDRETEITMNEFYGCTNLQSFAVGDGVESFGDWAFSGCQSLKSLSFGTKLKTIGKEAFSDCVSVTRIVSRTTTPPTCGTQALDDINKWSCTLIVPTGSLAAYQAADQWKDFFFVEEGDENGSTPIDPSGKKCAKPTISYTSGKLTFSSETEGATCMSTITDSDIMSYSTNEVQLTVTYSICVYATKDGYADSDVATATLCWIDVKPNTEGIDGGAASVRALPVLIQSHDGVLTIEGANEGTPISVYNAAGQLVGTATATTGTTTISATLHGGNVGIVRIGERAVKVIMK
jgi:hypothetical protein